MTDAELDIAAKTLTSSANDFVSLSADILLDAIITECRRARAAESALRGVPMADDAARGIGARLDAATPGPWRGAASAMSIYGYHDGLIARTGNPDAEMDEHERGLAESDADLIANAPADIVLLLTDRRYSQMLVSDKLGDDACAREERRRVVAWLRATASSYLDGHPLRLIADAIDEAARCIEAGHHVRMPGEDAT